ncbi:MAG: hypothetical protein AAF823_13075 [Planctomycetota bacterium]
MLRRPWIGSAGVFFFIEDRRVFDGLQKAIAMGGLLIIIGAIGFAILVSFSIFRAFRRMEEARRHRTQKRKDLLNGTPDRSPHPRPARRPPAQDDR